MAPPDKQIMCPQCMGIDLAPSANIYFGDKYCRNCNTWFNSVTGVMWKAHKPKPAPPAVAAQPAKTYTHYWYRPQNNSSGWQMGTFDSYLGAGGLTENVALVQVVKWADVKWKYTIYDPTITDVTRDAKAAPPQRKTMKLQINRKALMKHLAAYIAAEEKRYEDGMAAAATALAPVTEFVKSQKAAINKKLCVPIDTALTETIINCNVDFVCNAIGLNVFKPYKSTFPEVTSLLNKLNLSADENIEMDENDPALSFNIAPTNA
jgi:hypothetical protein